MDTIQRLTNKLEYYGTGIDWGTAEDVKVNLWPDLDNLRNYNNRNNLISDWRYKDLFEFADNAHANGRKIFGLMTWEASYAVALLMAIYH